MDPVTQGLLGAAASQSVCLKKLGKRAWLVGAVAGMLPDLDVLIRSGGDPLLFITYHRQFTHSLLFIPIGGLIAAAVMLLIFKNWRSQWRAVTLASVIAYGTHGLLDACTSYGTVLLWPFSYERIAWDLISIVDPIFTGLLLAGVLLSHFRLRAAFARVAIILCLAYLGFGYWQQQRVLIYQKQLVTSRQQQVIQNRATPTLGNVFRWRSLYATEKTIVIDTIYAPLFNPTYKDSGLVLPRYFQQDLPRELTSKLQQDFVTFAWFTDGYLTAFSQEPLILIDARYLLSYEPLIALWGIEFPSDDTRAHVFWRRHVARR